MIFNTILIRISENYIYVNSTYKPKVDTKEFEFIIIGGGASGVSAATKASELGISTLLINDGLPIGGTCVNVGCVPSKILIEMANNYYYSQFPQYDALLGKCACISEADFEKSVQEKNKMVEKLRKQNYQIPLHQMDEVSVLQGKASFVDHSTVKVNGSEYTGNNFLISTGSKPRIPDIDGLDEIEFLTSRDAFELDHVPESMVVIGAGPTGLELGQMFHHFGAKVTILEANDRVLKDGEPEIVSELVKSLREEKIDIQTSCDITTIKKMGDRKIIYTNINGEEKNFVVDNVLVTTGVEPNSHGLNLDQLEIKLDPGGHIKVDDTYYTGSGNIYAAGDVINRTWLETTAAREGYLVANNLFSNQENTLNYESVPYAIFTSPNYASVGLTENEANEKFDNVEAKVISFNKIPKAMALKETKGKVKMVVNLNNREILGVHIMARNAAEFITQAAMAIKYNLTIDNIIETVFVFPTMSEGIKKAAQAFIRDVSNMACCVE